MRVYLPSTLPALARLLADAKTAAPPVRGFAVTPALREWYSSGDEEELEYVAMTHAARASLRLLHGRPRRRRPPGGARGRGARREQVAAWPGSTSRPWSRSGCRSGWPTWSPATSTIRAAAADVRAAVAALPAADGGDEDARFTVDGAEGHELLWYATQELRHVTG